LSAATTSCLLFPIGLTIFALRGGSLALAAVNGAIFGLFTYATYDLTNQATLRKWTQLTLIDALGTLAASARFVASRFASAR
jgi:uncharacterized membrane protein